MRRDQVASFVHGLRVRLKGPTGSFADGARGVLWRCEPRSGARPYWRIRIQGTGQWVWPDDFVVDGPGTLVAECADCALPFLHRPGELICERCSVAQFGTVEQRNDPADVPYQLNPRGVYRRRRSK